MGGVRRSAGTTTDSSRRRGGARFATALLSALAIAGSLVVLDASPAAAVGNVNLDHCGNLPAPAATSAGSADWGNGALNSSKASYLEGQFVPQRAAITGLAGGTSYNIDILYDTTKENGAVTRHAFDYLGSVEATMTAAEPCAPSGLAGCTPGSFNTFPIPHDLDFDAPGIGVTETSGPNVAHRRLRIYGGTITGATVVHPPLAADHDFIGTESARLRITFTPTGANTVLAWGAHIATRTDWGVDGAAASISGSPFHVSAAGPEVFPTAPGSGGSQLQIQAGGIVSPGIVNITKDAAPNSLQDFSFSTTGTGLTPSTFILDDDSGVTGADNTRSNTQPFSITDFGAKSFTETLPSGWSLSAINCTLGGGAAQPTKNLGTGTMSMTVLEGQTYNCTFVNAQQNGTLNVIKTIGGGGTASPSDFTMQVRTGSTAGPIVASATGVAGPNGHNFTNLPAGNYFVTESITGPGGAGYVGNFSGCGNNGAVTVAAGGTTSCTVSNSPPGLGLTVTKVADETSVPETGDTVGYTVTVTNTSPVPVTVTTITDNQFTLDQENELGACEDAILAAADPNSLADTCQFTFQRFISGPAGGSHSNTITANAQDVELRPVSGQGSDSVGFDNVNPTISVTKDVVGSSSVPENVATQVTYTVTVTNGSAESVTVTSITDDKVTLNQDDDLGACEDAVLAPADPNSTADSCTFTYVGTVPAGNAGVDFVNEVTATATDGDTGSTPATAKDTATVTRVNVNPTISVTKDVVGSSSVPENVATQVTYTVTVTNGSAESVTVTSITDDKVTLNQDDDLGACEDAVLAPADPNSTADSCTFTYVGTVPAGNAGVDFVNEVTATATDGDTGSTPATAKDTATVTRVNVNPTISVTKDVVGSSTVPENTGATVTYSVTVTNGSAESVTVTSITDDKVTLNQDDDLGACEDAVLAPANPNSTADSCTFTYDLFVPAGNAGVDFVNEVTATAVDNDTGSTPATAKDTATVTRGDLPPLVSVEKDAFGTDSVPENVATQVTYTVTVTNPSLESVTVISITDNQFTLDPETDLGACEDAVLAPADPNSTADSCTFTYVGTVPAGNAGVDFVNEVTVTVQDDELGTVTDKDTATVGRSNVNPTISVTKDVVGSSSVPENVATQVTYTVTVTNGSAESVTVTSITDDKVTLNQDDDLGACEDAVLAPADPNSTADSCTFTYVGTVPAGNAGVDFVNEVTATATDGDTGSTPATAKDTATVTRVNVNPTISVTKDVVGSSSVPENVATQVTYTVTVTNGSAESVTVTSITDDKVTLNQDDDLGACEDAVLAPADPNSTADSCTFTYVGTVPAGNAGVDFVNEVTATATDGDTGSTPATAKDTATVTRVNVNPTISVTKDVVGSSSVPENVATQVTYTVTVTNGSAESVTVTSITDDKVTLNQDDDLGACEDAVLAPADPNSTADSCTFTYVGTVPAGNAGVDFVNEVTATATDGDTGSTPATAKDTATVTRFDVAPTVSVEKTVDPTSVPENFGGEVTYSVKVTNTSGEPVTITVLGDDPYGPQAGIDDVCEVGTILAPGASCTYTYGAFVDPQPTGSEFVNTASVTVRDDELGTATGTDTATVTFDPVANLTISKTACPEDVVPGGYLTYEITIGNDGNAPATNVVLTDTFPEGTSIQEPFDGGELQEDGATLVWEFESLAIGETITKTVVVYVDAENGSTLSNTAKVSADGVADAESTVETDVTNEGAQATSMAYGADVRVLGASLLGDGALGRAESSAPPSPDIAANEVLGTGLPGIVGINVLRQTARSDVGTAAVGQSSSTTTKISLLGGAITADAVKAVSTSIAGPTLVTTNTLGSTFTNLKINGKPVANVNPGTQVNVKLLGITIARAVLLEQTGDAAFGTPYNTANGSVNMIHVTLLQNLGSLAKGVEIIVGHAESSARYPNGNACGAIGGSVGGHAYTAFAQGRLNGEPVLTVKQGDANLPRFGGADEDEILGLDLSPLLESATGRNTTSGAISPKPNATSRAIVEGLNVLNGRITADVIDVKSTSTTNGAPSTVFNAVFANLRIGGTLLGPNPTPNTTIAIPGPGGELLLVVINEQVFSNGPTDTMGEVNALHVWVLKDGLIDLEVIVGSAGSEAHLPPLAP